MTDGQLLYLCLAGFYLIECLHWLPSHCISFRARRVRGRWQWGRSALDFSLAGFQPHLGTLLPTGGFFATIDWPVLPQRDGLHVGRHQIHEGQWVTWEHLEIQTEERNLWLNDALHVTCATPEEARRLGSLLQTIAAAPNDERDQLLHRWWQQSTSRPRAKRALKIRKLIHRQLAFPCWAIFLVCFVLIPTVYWFVGWKGYALLVAIVLLLCQSIEVTLRCFALEKRLHRQSTGARVAQAAQNFLLPIHAMKASEQLGVPLGIRVHPVALAQALLPKDAATAAIGRWFREWKFMAASDPMKASQSVWLPRIENWLTNLDLDLDSFQRPPDSLAPDERYCPCCHAIFTPSTLACRDCGGLPTIVDRA